MLLPTFRTSLCKRQRRSHFLHPLSPRTEEAEAAFSSSMFTLQSWGGGTLSLLHSTFHSFVLLPVLHFLSSPVQAVSPPDPRQVLPPPPSSLRRSSQGGRRNKGRTGLDPLRLALVQEEEEEEEEERGSSPSSSLSLSLSLYRSLTSTVSFFLRRVCVRVLSLLACHPLGAQKGRKKRILPPFGRSVEKEEKEEEEATKVL